MALMPFSEEGLKQYNRDMAKAIVHKGIWEAGKKPNFDAARVTTFNLGEHANMKVVGVNRRVFFLASDTLAARAPTLWHILKNNRDHADTHKYHIPMTPGRTPCFQFGNNIWTHLFLYMYSGHYRLPKKMPNTIDADQSWRYLIDDIRMYMLADKLEMRLLRHQAATLIREEMTEHVAASCNAFIDAVRVLYALAPATDDVLLYFLLHFYLDYEHAIHTRLGDPAALPATLAAIGAGKFLDDVERYRAWVLQNASRATMAQHWSEKMWAGVPAAQAAQAGQPGPSSKKA